MLRSVTAPTAAGGAMRRMRPSYCARASGTDSVLVAGTPAPMSSRAWICGSTGMFVIRSFGSTVVVAMGKCVIGPVNDGKPMERRAHLVPHRRIQRRGQRRLIVEHHLVALHMRDARPGQAAAPVYTGVDLDLPNAGKPRHDRRMVGDVVGQPGRQVLGRALIGDEVGAGLFARRRAECRDPARDSAAPASPAAWRRRDRSASSRCRWPSAASAASSAAMSSK